MGGLPGEPRVGRQVAVERVGNLVGVVADPPQLVEEGGVHDGVGGPRAGDDPAVAHEPLAQTRYGQTQLARLS